MRLITNIFCSTTQQQYSAEADDSFRPLLLNTKNLYFGEISKYVARRVCACVCAGCMGVHARVCLGIFLCACACVCVCVWACVSACVCTNMLCIDILNRPESVICIVSYAAGSQSKCVPSLGHRILCVKRQRREQQYKVGPINDGFT